MARERALAAVGTARQAETNPSFDTKTREKRQRKREKSGKPSRLDAEAKGGGGESEAGPLW